jgi:hypothetical protein
MDEKYLHQCRLHELKHISTFALNIEESGLQVGVIASSRESQDCRDALGQALGRASCSTPAAVVCQSQELRRGQVGCAPNPDKA